MYKRQDCNGCTATDVVTVSEPTVDGGRIAVGTCNNGTIVIGNDVAPNVPSGHQFEVVWIKSQGQFSACQDLGQLGTGNTNVGAAYDAFIAAGGFGSGASPMIPNTTSWMFITDNDGDDLQLTVNDSPMACYLRCVRVVGCERFTGESQPVATQGCFAPPTCEVNGGVLTGGPFEFCVADGIADNIPADAINLTGGVGSVRGWIVTDDQGNILGLPPTFSAVDFDGAGDGVCLVYYICLLYTSPSPRDATLSRMPSSA